jgi:hypothetical protein
MKQRRAGNEPLKHGRKEEAEGIGEKKLNGIIPFDAPDC